MLKVERLGNRIQVLNQMEGQVDLTRITGNGPRQQYEERVTPAPRRRAHRPETRPTSLPTVQPTPTFNLQEYCSNEDNNKGQFSSQSII